MPRKALATLATATLIMTVTSASAQDVIRMGTEGAYPPYNFINDAGEVDGLERELGDELCKRAELTCEWVTNDWDSIIPNLVSGNYDTIIAGMSITSEREEVISFSQNYVMPAASSYVALGADVDLSNAVIAAQANTVESNYVANGAGTLVEFATAEESIAAVRNGEVDAVFADKGYLSPIVAESGGELVWVGEDVRIGKGIGIGFRQSDDALRAKFDAAIQSTKDDGTLNELLTKWLEEEAELFQ